MSRVLSDTALRRAAAMTLVAVATTFAACGDDASTADPPSASTPAPATTATTPTTNESPKAEAKPSTSDKSAKSTASTSKPSKASTTLDKEIRHVRSALKSAGYKLEPAVAANATTGSIRLDGASIFFFQTDDSASDAEKAIRATYKKNGAKVAVARDGKQVFIVRAQSGQPNPDAVLKKLQADAAA